MNELKGETSPYLLQHADNPVEWFPWGEAALHKAKEENKPILLSIGYSACHWCHVMAHESFEDPTTAQLMNELFVNIKVDREERPDIDKIYQSAQQLITQHPGGWPLTMFLTPDDQVPFFGGTYFPDSARHGLPAFADVLARVASAYREREADIRGQNAKIIEALDQMQELSTVAVEVFKLDPITSARQHMDRIFDHRLGGFGRAPKFPHPSNLERLLREFMRSDREDEQALNMVRVTLTRMAKGGIYDHLGGGFCRYSVDDQWMIPHFEKMLYDNGPLLALYAQTWQLEHDALFEQVVHETAAWVRREMTSPEGAFYSSLDADSEGEEGKFYVWDKSEIEALLKLDYEPFARRFGLTRDANYEGRWHLRILAEYHEIANIIGGDGRAVEQRVDAARARLFEHREARIHPGRDEKILTSWNALMIKGLAIAGNVFQHDDYIDAAQRAVDFIRTQLWRDGRLLATYKDGTAHLNAYLDDYAFLIDALLHVLAARWRNDDLNFAIELADCLVTNFQDDAGGGFFFTAHDHEALIQRTKPMTDDALPAGNGIAAWSLGRLGHLLGESRYLDAAAGCLSAAWHSIERAPSAHNALLLALEEYLDPPTSVILRGDLSELDEWKKRLDASYAPARQYFAIPTEAHDLPGLLSHHTATRTVTAYVCRGHQCLAPIHDLAELERLLDTD
ncbi:MAG: thioredoxin domain-containing protein [Proteobacteria bacterium]|nr:MAG: thioredoxin domain-containing protein [Pseudomonadota bacterium]